MSKRAKRLNEIKRVRAIRDELLKCDNDGRQYYLLQALPPVWCVELFKRNGEVKRVEITNYDRYTYQEWGANAFKKLGALMYMQWLKNYCN